LHKSQQRGLICFGNESTRRRKADEASVQNHPLARIPPLPNGVPKPSSRRAKMPSYGMTPQRVHGCEIRPFRRANAWAHAFEKSGVAITGEVWLRPKCTASNGWASACWLELLSVRSRSYTSARRCSTVSPDLGVL